MEKQTSQQLIDEVSFDMELRANGINPKVLRENVAKDRGEL